MADHALRTSKNPVKDDPIHTPSNGRPAMHPDILKYNQAQEPDHAALCALLAEEIGRNLPDADSKIWHGHPVWFLNGNPVVGYSKQKQSIRLMFWSGADFEEPALDVSGGKFKDASVFLNDVAAVKTPDLKRWLKKARDIQWNYRDIVKRKGRLERLN